MRNYDWFKKTYDYIVYDVRNNLLIADFEVHHILPRSLGGLDSLENRVRLTYRQHFICHWLLWKMSTGKDREKMALAFKFMKEGQQGKFVVLNSITFARVKKEASLFQSNRQIGIKKPYLNGNQFARHKHTPEQNLRKSKRQIGGKRKPETIERMKIAQSKSETKNQIREQLKRYWAKWRVDNNRKPRIGDEKYL